MAGGFAITFVWIPAFAGITMYTKQTPLQKGFLY